MTVDTSKDPSRIASMFDAIARRYDFLNHVLSGGLDVYWRRRALAALDLSNRDVLVDVCTGTGDVAIGAMRLPTPPGCVIGVDFADVMLAMARRKIALSPRLSRIALVRGDAMRLPLGDGAADAMTIAFGIRNVTDPHAACVEMCRALNANGRLAVLEFAMPEGAIMKRLYGTYVRRILPLLGRVISGHRGAYSYLPASIGAFPDPAAFAATIRAAGFADVRPIPLTFGTVYLYLARKAARAA